jgi:hypothetical protein
MKRTSRKPSNLSSSLQRHLNAYALAASAAGVGMLALAHPADAKVIYTPANKTLPKCLFNRDRPCFRLDLNHDNIIDFRIPWFFDSKSAALSIRPAKYKTKNRIWGTLSSAVCTTTQHKHPLYVASALNSGVSLGPNSLKFQAKHYKMWGVGHGGSGTCNWGQWYGVQKYVGLMFYIKGNIHYGWARLDATFPKPKLTGYAYETIPGKPIITGKTKGPDVITLERGSLGRLARGSAGRSGK